MRNFVAKNDFNRASTHRDRKNDYNRDWDLENELELYEDSTTNGDNNQGVSDESEEGSKPISFVTTTS